MTELRKEIIVFWGSQSGKAERLANSLVRECTTRFNLPAMAANLDLFDYDQLGHLSKGRIVGFIVATYGEGGPTDNASGLDEYLRKIAMIRAQPLSRLQYFCFGLGDSKYQFYNKFIDDVNDSFANAGAKRIIPVGKLDVTDRSDEDWLSWKKQLLKTLAERHGSQEIDISGQLPMFDIINTTDGWSNVSHVAESPGRQQQLLRVSQSLQLSGSSPLQKAQNDGKYLHLELEADTHTRVIQYDTGDHVAIWPINPNNEVALLESAFGWDKKSMKAPIDIVSRDLMTDSIPIPTPTTREALLQYQLDICGPVSHEILDLLVSHSPNKDSKEYLTRCRPDICSQYLTCGQLMKLAAPEATWSEDVLSGFLSLMPRIRPRYFSIASSPLMQQNTLAITVSLHEKQTPQSERLFVGLISGYLGSLHMAKSEIIAKGQSRHTYNFDGPRSILSGYKVFAHVRKSTFKLPVDLETPVLMIAVGSGIAPFRGFVQERMALTRKGKSVGRMILLYGSRSKEDCLYQNLWSEAKDMGILTAHFVLSCQLVKGKKFYVQHKLLELGEDTAKLVQSKNGSVYICGSTDMANEVKSNLDLLLGGGETVKQLKESRRLQEDVWAS